MVTPLTSWSTFLFPLFFETQMDRTPANYGRDPNPNGPLYSGPIRHGGYLSSGGASNILRHMNMENQVQRAAHIPLTRAEHEDIAPGSNLLTDDTLFQIEDLSNNRFPLSRIITYLQLQPVGTRTHIPLEGYTIGQLVHGMQLAGIDLRGYFVSGVLTKLEPKDVNAAHPPNELDAGNSPYGWGVERFSITEFPLHRVALPMALATMEVNDFENLTLMEYIDFVRYSQEGSSVAYHILWEGCHIKRRQGPGVAIVNTLTYAVMTGGFAQLLTKDYSTNFNYPTCPKFDPNTQKPMRENRRMLLTNLEGKIFIPSGGMNCVEACVKHLFAHRYDRVADWYAPTLESGNSGGPDAHLDGGNVLSMSQADLQARDVEKIHHIFETFCEKYVDEKLKTKKFTRMRCSTAEKRERAKKSYKKLIKGGYSNTFLRKLIKHFREESNIILHIFYIFHDGSHTQPYRLRDRGESFYPNDNSDNDKTHLCLFQMRLDGTIFSNEEGVQVHDPTEGEGEKNYLGFLHMIGVYVENELEMEDKLLPLLVRKKAKKAFFPCVQFVNWLSDNVLQPYMKKVQSDMVYKSDISKEDIVQSVTYQLQRESEGKVPTLIFNDAIKKGKLSDDKELSDHLRLQRFNENLKRGECAVVAYDLETVELTVDTIDTIRPEFRLSTATREEMINGGYQPVESVVPFSAQWVPVNVSYRGRMIERAREARTRIMNYKFDNALIGKVIENTTIPISDVILKPVETCYGGDRLGECFEEMLLKIAKWAYEGGYGYVFAYAHNGCGFDAYVGLRYCTFEIVGILKTSRGILILDYKVPTGVVDPITHKEIFVTIRLRDTRVWLSGNLKRIAESFKCPKIWQKIDFPITLMNHRNCYDQRIRDMCQAYGENDVLALAWIIRELNSVIGESPWDPASIYSVKPAIAQFVTVMGMVKAATLNHFKRELPRSYIQTLPSAVDIPFLRNWLKKATIGGRVEAYARSYVSPYFGSILNAYDTNNTEELKNLYRQMNETNGCDMVLDVTSLYPTAQSLCPMPTGKLYSLTSVEQCQSLIDSIHCTVCESQCKLCDQHRNDTRNVCDSGPLRPFAIILVRNLTPPQQSSTLSLYPFCARKLENDKGLVYTYETNEEIRERFGDPNIIKDVQSYTNVDLYWMQKLGFTFEIVGGFGWETSDTYMNFLLDAFELRKKAKEQGNAVMSEFIKLQINGSYGVTAQGDIEDNGILVTLPDNLRMLHPQDGQVQQFLHTKRRQQLEHSEYIKDGLLLPNGQTFFTKAKAVGIAEYFNALSPMQIGAAVLAWARHVVNLIIFHPVVTPMKYTDTDSIEISLRSVKFLEQHCPGVIDHSKTAALGTLKNDHLDSCGPGARVIFGVFGTKKVKMYIVMTEDGKLHICTTFKGLNPRMIDDHGMRYHVDKYEHCIAQSLLEIFYEGRAETKEVTSWKRSMHEGVRINNHLQQFSSETYLDRSLGSSFEERRGNGLTEMFIPFGVKDARIDNVFYNNAIASLKGKKDMRIAGNDRRQRRLKAFMNGYGKEEMMVFLQKYYSHKDEFHLMENDEFKKMCDTILETI